MDYIKEFIKSLTQEQRQLLAIIELQQARRLDTQAERSFELMKKLAAECPPSKSSEELLSDK